MASRFTESETSSMSGTQIHHMCMSARGVGKSGSSMRTAQFSGLFQTDPEQMRAFYEGIRPAP